MSIKGKSRRAFLIDSVVGVNAAWIAANYHDILAAQEHAGKGSQPPKLAFFTAEQAAEVEAMAHTQGGHAYLFRNLAPVVGAKPPAALLAIHQRLKRSFDPHGIFNPGLMGGGF